MFCAQCGTPNADQSQFCVKCGAAVQAMPSAVSAPAPPSSGIAAGASSAAPAGPVITPSGWPAPPAGISSYTVPTQPYTGPTETSGKAIGSLICGIFFLFFPATIGAVLLGHLSLSDIRKSAGHLTGRGVATAGLVLGYLGLALMPFIIAAIAIPNLLRSRMAANEASAVESLRVIELGTVSYYSMFSNGYPPNLAALGGVEGQGNCDHAQMIDAVLASGQKSGYIFSYTPLPQSNLALPALSPQAVAKGCTMPGPARFAVAADPVERGTTGQRSFYVDQSGTIRVSSSNAAGPDSPPLE